jgi:hypothetical protein
LFEHDLFRKPVSTFRDHALDVAGETNSWTADGAASRRLADGRGRNLIASVRDCKSKIARRATLRRHGIVVKPSPL